MSDLRNGRVTVVIPTYNRAEFLAGAVRSVLGQTAAARCDIVVVDDGSTDHTREVVAGFAERVQYIHQPRGGVSAARNTAIRTRPNEFVAFLDSDDRWLPDKIERQLAAFERWPEAVLAAGPTQARMADGSVVPHPAPAVPRDCPFDLAPQMFAGCVIETPSVVVRASKLSQAGLFCEGLERGEDYDLWLRLACQGPAVYLSGPPLATYGVDAPLSLSAKRSALAAGILKALYRTHGLLRRRPDCRPAWKQHVLECLCVLRDHARRDGRDLDLARYSLNVLLRQPWRPRWEWRSCLEAWKNGALRHRSMHASRGARRATVWVRGTEFRRGRVDVIIPTYNRAHLIGAAIRSVLAQTAAQRCDVVVVDDGSTDNTVAVLAEFGERVRYLHQTNAGPAAARNAGILATHSEFLAFLDADDVWLPDKIERQLAAFNSAPSALFVAGRALDRIADGALCSRPDPPMATDVPLDLAPYLFNDNFVPTSTVMLRRSGLRDVGLFRPDLPQCEDYHLWLRLACRGPGIFLEAPLTIYAAADPGSLTRNHAVLLRSNLRARMLFRRELLKRPECRVEWRNGMASCLAHLRDECYRRGEFEDAAWFGAGSLLYRPWPRPKWELGRVLAAAARAPASIIRAAHASQLQHPAMKDRPRCPIAALP